MAKELSYIEKLIPFITNMRVGEGEDQPTPPTPSSLTPFVDGQELKVGDKIKFNLSLDKSIIDNFLNSIEYPTEGNLCILLAPNEGDDILTAMDLTKVGFDTKFIISDADKMTIFYSTNTVTDPGSGVKIEAGWQPIVLENDGEIEMSLEEGNTTLDHLNDVEGWNGIIAGYVAGEPGPGDLTPFEAGGSLHAGDKIKVNLNASNEDVCNYLSTLTYDQHSSTCFLLNTTNHPGESGQSMRIAAMNFGTSYVIMATDATGYPSAFFGYDTETQQGGWNLENFDVDPEDETKRLDTYTIKVEGGVEYYKDIELNDTASEWNGVFIGVVKGE